MSTNSLPTWEERTGGIQRSDASDRQVRFQHSRFHGVMVSVGGNWAYWGDPKKLIEWLQSLPEYALVTDERTKK